MSSSKVSVVSVDLDSLSFNMESVFELASSKVIGMCSNDSKTAVSIFTVDTVNRQKTVVRKILRKKLFNSTWVLN